MVAGYNGNLYVADPGADQIWRYAPTANGYEGEPSGWFQAGKAPDMANLVDLGIDGRIWMLYSDGRLLKFLSGEQQPFTWTDLPDPLNGPTALAVSQEGDRLYVADPGNARIVEATKDGKFLRQFKAREGDLLRNVRDLYLDEAKGFFYIVTGDQLYKASVPQPGADPVAPLEPTAPWRRLSSRRRFYLRASPPAFFGHVRAEGYNYRLCQKTHPLLGLPPAVVRSCRASCSAGC